MDQIRSEVGPMPLELLKRRRLDWQPTNSTLSVWGLIQHHLEGCHLALMAPHDLQEAGAAPPCLPPVTLKGVSKGNWNLPGFAWSSVAAGVCPPPPGQGDWEEGGNPSHQWLHPSTPASAESVKKHKHQSFQVFHPEAAQALQAQAEVYKQSALRQKTAEEEAEAKRQKTEVITAMLDQNETFLACRSLRIVPSSAQTTLEEARAANKQRQAAGHDFMKRHTLVCMDPSLWPEDFRFKMQNGLFCPMDADNDLAHATPPEVNSEYVGFLLEINHNKTTFPPRLLEEMPDLKVSMLKSASGAAGASGPEGSAGLDSMEGDAAKLAMLFWATKYHKGEQRLHAGIWVSVPDWALAIKLSKEQMGGLERRAHVDEPPYEAGGLLPPRSDAGHQGELEEGRGHLGILGVAMGTQVGLPSTGKKEHH
eukprot:s579_g18.t1